MGGISHYEKIRSVLISELVGVNGDEAHSDFHKKLLENLGFAADAHLANYIHRLRTFRLEMFKEKVSRWKLVTLFIHIIALAAPSPVKNRESTYRVFKIPKIIPPCFENLAEDFEWKDYATVQIDVFIDAKTGDSTPVNCIVENCSRKSAVVVTSSSKLKKYVEFKNPNSKLENLILFYDSADRIDLEVLKMVYESRWNSRARIIAYVEKVDKIRVTEILRYFWNHDLLNVALRVQSETSLYEPGENFIYNPFVQGILPDSKGRVERVNSGDSIFPDKLADLHNHTIPISVFYHFPGAILTNFTTLKEGADIEILRALSKKLNFNVDLKTANVYGPSYTVVLPNGEELGMIGDVLVNRSDIVLNVQPIGSTIGYPVEFTYPMSQTGYCVLVPKSMMMPMIVRMALPFSDEIWLAVIVAVGLLVICFTLMGENNKFIKISELLFHHHFADVKKYTINRILAISCIFWSYLLSFSYQANFINELIFPKYYKDIDTLEELYDSNLPLIVGDNVVEILNNSDVPVLEKLGKRAVKKLVFNDCAHQLFTYFNVSCGVDEYITGLFSKLFTKNNQTLLIHSVKECLSINWDVYVVRKGFPFLDKFNRFIKALLEAGLYRKWVIDLVSKRRTRIVEPRTGKLTMKHFEGVFGILIFGFFISGVTFILELAVFHFPYLKIASIFRRMKLKLGNYRMS